MPIGLKGNTDGSGAIQIGGSDAITISTGLNTTFAGTATVPTGTLYPIVSGTAVASTSGTAIDFTGIPSWVKRITIMFNGVSTNGTSNLQIQIGSGSFTTSGYSSQAWDGTGGGVVTTGFALTRSTTAANTYVGTNVLVNITSNTWTNFGLLGLTSATSVGIQNTGVSGNLSGALDRVRITTVNGTDTFDAGSINILYE